MQNPMAIGDRRSGVYQIVNCQNHKVYVGSAVNLRVRWRAHVKALNEGKHHSPHLQHAWDLYGAEAFGFEVVEYCSRADLIGTEQRWINEAMEQGNAYNVSPTAGSPLGVVRSDGHKEKMRVIMLGNQRSKGAVRSPETRALMSAAATGRVASDETRARLSESHKGIVPSEETREKHRVNMLGNQHRLGQPASEETRAKQSGAHQGNQNARGPHRKFSEETKANMRAAWVLRKAKALEAINEK